MSEADLTNETQDRPSLYQRYLVGKVFLMNDWAHLNSCESCRLKYPSQCFQKIKK